MGMGLLPMTGPPRRVSIAAGWMHTPWRGLAPTPPRRRRTRVARICSCSSPPAGRRARPARGLLDRLLEPVVALAGAHSGAVRLLSESGERLQLVSDIGLPNAVHRCEATVDRGCGICGDAAGARRIVWSSDLRASAPSAAATISSAAPAAAWWPCRCSAAAACWGVYNLFFADEAEPSPQVMALLRSVGELLGLALDNARLEAQSVRASVMQERQAMAAEIHDSIAQTLTFVKMRLPLLQDAVAEGDEARARLADVRQAVATRTAACARSSRTSARASTRAASPMRWRRW